MFGARRAAYKRADRTVPGRALEGEDRGQSPWLRHGTTMWMLFGLALGAIWSRYPPLMYHVVRIPTI
jgi:hypothetical protein